MTDPNRVAAHSVLALNWYYARTPNLASDVLATRLRACEVREQLGIPAGRVLRRTGGADALPDVIWDCPFDGVAGHDADMAVRAASADFEACRLRMRTLTRRFERVLYSVGESDLALRDFEADRSYSYQRWLHANGSDTGSAEGLPWVVALPPGARRRIGEGAALPDWIVEASGADALKAMPISSDTVLDIVDSTWERIR